MKVLFLARYLNSSGVTTHMLTLGEELIKKGNEVAILSGGIEPHSKEKVSELIKDTSIHIINNKFPIKRTNKILELSHYILCIPSTISLIKNFAPDIIHVHWPVTSYMAALYRKIFSVPVIQTFHLGNSPKSILHRKADKVIAISSELEKQIEENFGYHKKDICKIFNGVNVDKFRRDEIAAVLKRNTLSIKESDIVITFVGSLDLRKGLDVLLEALSKVKLQESLKVIILGDGDKNLVLKSPYYQKYSKNIILLPFQNPYDYYNISDVLVLPSRKEGFPLVILEAMFMEVAVVRSSVEGAKDQIENEVDGMLFTSESVEELQIILEKLISDSELRRGIAEKGENKAQKLFRSETMAEKTLNLYQDALNGFK